jgi:hypothetical protein
VARVERLIVYVDDLDRCSPERVAEVVRALHVIFALSPFAVVLAADPMRLLRCVGADHLDEVVHLPFALPAFGPDEHAAMVERLASAEGEPAAAPEPTEGELRLGTHRLSPAEVACLKVLHAAVPTPAGSRRMVDAYRVLKARVPPEDLDRFVAGEFAAALLLLAVQLGDPGRAAALEALLRDADGVASWAGALALLTGRAASSEARPPFLGLSAEGGDAVYLGTGEDRIPLPSDLALYARWMPVVRRFGWIS